MLSFNEGLVVLCNFSLISLSSITDYSHSLESVNRESMHVLFKATIPPPQSHIPFCPPGIGGCSTSYSSSLQAVAVGSGPDDIRHVKNRTQCPPPTHYSPSLPQGRPVRASRSSRVAFPLLYYCEDLLPH